MRLVTSGDSNTEIAPLDSAVAEEVNKEIGLGVAVGPVADPRYEQALRAYRANPAGAHEHKLAAAVALLGQHGIAPAEAHATLMQLLSPAAPQPAQARGSSYPAATVAAVVRRLRQRWCRGAACAVAAATVVPSTAGASGFDVPRVGSLASGPLTRDAAAVHHNPGQLGYLQGGPAALHPARC